MSKPHYPDLMALVLDFVYEPDRAATLGAVGRLMKGKLQYDFENRYVRKDGQVVHQRLLDTQMRRLRRKVEQACGLRLSVATENAHTHYFPHFCGCSCGESELPAQTELPDVVALPVVAKLAGVAQA